jgi:hypothetical protein
MKPYEEHTEEEINFMRKHLADCELFLMNDEELRELLWNGVRGWVNIPDDEIIDLYHAGLSRQQSKSE